MPKKENAIFHIETYVVIQSFLCVYEKDECFLHKKEV